MGKIDRTLAVLLVVTLALTAAASTLSGWIMFVIQLSLSVGMVSLGLMVLSRAGLISFGQGLFYCIGGYAVALVGRGWGLTDAFLSVFLGAASAVVIAMPIGLFVARYRQIFFAMLTLALSMIAYGMVLKIERLGGTDGLNVSGASFAGFRPAGESLRIVTFIFSCWVTAFCTGLVHLYLKSSLGRLGDAIRDNELRLEYLGLSVRATIFVQYVIASATAGVAGALTAISARHVDPGFAFWTTSGEFVFVVLLSGNSNILAPFLGAGFLEFLRSFAFEKAPNSWQLILGAIMLGVVLYLPDGLWSLGERLRDRRARS